LLSTLCVALDELTVSEMVGQGNNIELDEYVWRGKRERCNFLGKKMMRNDERDEVTRMESNNRY